MRRSDRGGYLAPTVYRDVPADGPPPTLSKSYIDRAMPAVAEQIKRAGVRLAAVLNAALR